MITSSHDTCSLKCMFNVQLSVNCVYSGFRQAKLENGHSGQKDKFTVNDFPIKLPATLLAECTIEISNKPSKNSM